METMTNLLISLVRFTGLCNPLNGVFIDRSIMFIAQEVDIIKKCQNRMKRLLEKVDIQLRYVDVFTDNFSGLVERSIRCVCVPVSSDNNLEAE